MSNSQETAVAFTALALDMIKKAVSQEGYEGFGLRIAVVGGGCSGLGYALDFENQARAGDEVYEVDGVKVFVDFASFQYLRGTEIDFIQNEHGSGFKFNNPDAVTKCHCGCGH